MAAKRTRVSDAEKEKMWQLFQEGYTFTKIAQKMRRGTSTVARYVNEYQAAVRAAGYILNARDKGEETT